MKTFRNALPIGIMGFCGLGALYCLYLSANTNNPTPRETAYIGILLCFLSVITSWIASHHYAIYTAKTGTEEKIDTIAQQSTEKIMNQSAQLWDVEQYLESSLAAAEEEANTELANNTLKNRLQAAAQMIRLLRSSNNTFTSDWTGIVSATVKSCMEKKVKEQQDLLKNYSQPREFGSVNENRLEHAAKFLPASALPTTPATYDKTVTLAYSASGTPDSKFEGQILLHVLKPVDNATGRVKLNPEWSGAPRVTVVLKKAPQGIDIQNLTVKAGTANTRGFNVHMTSNESDLVPAGYYELAYEVKPNEKTGEDLAA